MLPEGKGTIEWEAEGVISTCYDHRVVPEMMTIVVICIPSYFVYKHVHIYIYVHGYTQRHTRVQV